MVPLNAHRWSGKTSPTRSEARSEAPPRGLGGGGGCGTGAQYQLQVSSETKRIVAISLDVREFFADGVVINDGKNVLYSCLLVRRGELVDGEILLTGQEMYYVEQQGEVADLNHY